MSTLWIYIGSRWDPELAIDRAFAMFLEKLKISFTHCLDDCILSKEERKVQCRDVGTN